MESSDQPLDATGEEDQTCKRCAQAIPLHNDHNTVVCIPLLDYRPADHIADCSYASFVRNAATTLPEAEYLMAKDNPMTPEIQATHPPLCPECGCRMKSVEIRETPLYVMTLLVGCENCGITMNDLPGTDPGKKPGQ